MKWGWWSVVRFILDSWSLVCDRRWFFVCSYRMPCTPINYANNAEKVKRKKKQTKQKWKKTDHHHCRRSISFEFEMGKESVRSDTMSVVPLNNNVMQLGIVNWNGKIPWITSKHAMWPYSIWVYLEFLHFRRFGYLLDVRMSKTLWLRAIVRYAINSKMRLINFMVNKSIIVLTQSVEERLTTYKIVFIVLSLFFSLSTGNREPRTNC